MSSEFCENFKALAVQKYEGGMDKRIAVRLRCGMWTCEYCAMRNRAIWRAKIIHHIFNTDCDWCWFTITAHRYARGAQKSVANLRGAWDALMKRTKRKFGDFQYVRVYEKHADGSYHIHAIASFNFGDTYIRKSRKKNHTHKKVSVSRWLQKNCFELGLGMITHAEDIKKPEFDGEIKPVHAGYVASYITKYVVKLDAQTKNEFGRIRHIQTSQKWLKKPEFASDGSFEFKYGLYYDDMIHAHENGYRFELNGYIPDYEDYENTYIFPSDFDHRVAALGAIAPAQVSVESE